MEKTLFILSKQKDQIADDIIAETENGTVVLVQDAVYRQNEWSLPVYAEKDDVEARGIRSRYELVEIEGILDLIELHSHVIVL